MDELIEKLRILQSKNSLSLYKREVCRDAADALEAAEKRIAELEAVTERLKASNEELRERQTYIDHWGNKWMTSGKDVPTAAYNHGFLDGEQACNGGAKMDGERKEQSDG